MKEIPLQRRTRGNVTRKKADTFKGICSGGPLDGQRILASFFFLLFGAHILLRKQRGKPRRCATYKWTDKKLGKRDVWKFVRYEVEREAKPTREKSK